MSKSRGDETVGTWLLTTEGNLDSTLSIRPDLLTGVKTWRASDDLSLCGKINRYHLKNATSKLWAITTKEWVKVLVNLRIFEVVELLCRWPSGRN